MTTRLHLAPKLRMSVQYFHSPTHRRGVSTDNFVFTFIRDSVYLYLNIRQLTLRWLRGKPSQGSPIIHSPCPQPGFSHDPQSLPQPGFSHDPQSLPPVRVFLCSTVPAPSQSSPTQIAHDTYWTGGRVAMHNLSVLEQKYCKPPENPRSVQQVTAELQTVLSLRSLQLCNTDCRSKWPPAFRKHTSVSLKTTFLALMTISPFAVRMQQCNVAQRRETLQCWYRCNRDSWIHCGVPSNDSHKNNNNNNTLKCGTPYADYPAYCLANLGVRSAPNHWTSCPSF
jgi:hypothetical protein